MEENKINSEELENDNYERECADSEEAMGQIAVQQELERWELQSNPVAKLSEETSKSKFFKESIIYAETMGTAFQTLLGYGIDYQNAISMVNNMMISDQNIRQAEKQSVQIQSQQI